MTVQTLLSQQYISTDDNLLTHSALLHTIPLWPFILFKQNQTKTSISADVLSPVNIVTRRVEIATCSCRKETNLPFTAWCCLLFSSSWSETYWNLSFKISQAASAVVSRCILSWPRRCGWTFAKHFGCLKLGTCASFRNGHSERSALFC